MAKGIRLDQLLVDRGLVESRARAQALVLAGLVYAGERKLEKAGQAIAPDADIHVRGRDHPWVSRGGLKLAHGFAHFGWDVGRRGRDRCRLLHRRLHRRAALARRDARVRDRFRERTSSPGSSGRMTRVIVHERTNARALTAELVPEPVDLVVCDASFIGLAKVLPAALALAKPGGRAMALIKPQFEAAREEIGKGGVVRDPVVRERVCEEVASWLENIGWQVEGIVESPITGPEGNHEFLVAAHRRGFDSPEPFASG